MIKIDKFIPGGQTIATAPDGKKIFFWNALPGEEVTDYTITKTKSRYSEAIANSVKNPSGARVSPQDDCFLSTSPWQILKYPYELSTKQSLVVEIFREHGIHLDTPPITTDDHPYFYRNKMEYSLYWDNDTNLISLAFHARGSHRKLPISQSSLEYPEIFASALKIVNDLNLRHEEARKYQSILLRSDASGNVSGGLYENGHPHPVFPHLTDTILGHTYSYSPNGFFQINLPVYEAALRVIMEYISTNKVLDLYAGVGTIGLSVARDRELTLVETDASAFRELARNVMGGAVSPSTDDVIKNNKITAILSRAEDALGHVTNNATVIVDPPRAGCDTRLINRLLEVTPPRIIYLSCNPATQARDVAILLTKYHITDVQTFNFFPRTPHIENLIVLSL